MIKVRASQPQHYRHSPAIALNNMVFGNCSFEPTPLTRLPGNSLKKLVLKYKVSSDGDYKTTACDMVDLVHYRKIGELR